MRASLFDDEGGVRMPSPWRQPLPLLRSGDEIRWVEDGMERTWVTAECDKAVGKRTECESHPIAKKRTRKAGQAAEASA